MKIKTLMERLKAPALLALSFVSVAWTWAEPDGTSFGHAVEDIVLILLRAALVLFAITMMTLVFGYPSPNDPRRADDI